MKLPFKTKRKNPRQLELMQINEERTHILTPESNFYVREAYNTLRTNIDFSLTDDVKCQTLVLTSANPSEGKSITSVNLAISMAETDKKVILIDCDMRKPKTGRLLNVKSPFGLSNVLMDVNKLPQAICSYCTNLDVILAGNIPPNPTKLLGSPRMQRLLEILQERYDYIILDTPPVNVVADSMVLAPKANGTLFVVRAGHSERGDVVRAAEQLEYAKAKIIGFVLNGVDIQRSSYGKYRYKRYGYGYGHHKHGYYGYGYENAQEWEKQHG